jgi:serine protease AprX
MARRTLVTLACLLVATGVAAAEVLRLDSILLGPANSGNGVARVIIQARPGVDVEAIVRDCGGLPGPRFQTLSAQVADVPHRCLTSLATHPGVRAVSADRAVRGALQTNVRSAVGATWVADRLGFDGTGIGVAIIDSGVAAWHDDLSNGRVVHFADFVSRQNQPYDDYGHGTHVAGIIAGNGQSSGGVRRGIAPGAHLIVLKALGSEGQGNVSHVVAAIDYAIRHRVTFNIRIINLSVAAGVHESYNTDPLTQAARRAVEAGIVVITAAGNLGRDGSGAAQYGGITAPGNAPWVLTVGASNDNGTVDRRDDTVAAFSSRGPGIIDGAIKPDLVAPGVAIESLGDPASLLYVTRPGARRWGTVNTANEPYMALSGTSMAAPVVAGTVALMLHANPTLSPASIKVILQRTAEGNGRYDQLTQGAGFLNARAAVEAASALAADASADASQGGTQ